MLLFLGDLLFCWCFTRHLRQPPSDSFSFKDDCEWFPGIIQRKIDSIAQFFFCFFFCGLWPPTLPWLPAQSPTIFAQPLQLTPVQGKKHNSWPGWDTIEWFPFQELLATLAGTFGRSFSGLTQAGILTSHSSMRDGGGEGLMALDVVSR